MKASNNQILTAMIMLKEEKAEEWEARFGPGSIPFTGMQRADVQDKVETMLDISYTSAGFRSRLRTLEDKGILTSIRIGDRTKFYFTNTNKD